MSLSSATSVDQGIMALSFMEQSPRSRNIYNQLCFCYSLADDASRSTIVSTLTRGLERLTAGFPWLAGQVVIKVAPFEKIPRLVVTDLTRNSSAPTMAALREAKFPYSMPALATVRPGSNSPIVPSRPVPGFLKGLWVYRPAKQVYD
jgi:hypothetical protein